MIILCAIFFVFAIFLLYITQQQKKSIVYWQQEYSFYKDKHRLLQEEYGASSTKHIENFNMLSQVIKEKGIVFTEKHAAMQEHIEMLGAENKALMAHLNFQSSVVENQSEVIRALEKIIPKKSNASASN